MSDATAPAGAGPGVGLQVDDGVAVVTIDRPARRNALHLDALEALDVALDRAGDVGVRSLVLTGAGGHFCAGADLSELEDLTFTHRLREVLDHLADLPVPTIAVIEGSCMGLGMQLALACDVRIAAEGASFAVPVARLGLMVDHWTLQRLVDGWGNGAARLMVLSAEVLDTDDAVAAGFVQRRGGMAEARRLTERIATLAPLSVAGSKLGLNLLDRRLDEPAYTAAFRRAWESEDLVEGRRAFAERRAPVFRGR